MSAGELDTRVTIQARTQARDSYGGFVNGWQTVATVWAKVTTLRGQEFFAAAAVQSKVDTRVRIRHFNGIRTSMRVVQQVELNAGGSTYRYFDIVQIVPDQARRSFIVLMCAEREADGFHTADTSGDSP